MNAFIIIISALVGIYVICLQTLVLAQKRRLKDYEDIIDNLQYDLKRSQAETEAFKYSKELQKQHFHFINSLTKAGIDDKYFDNL